MKTYLMKIAHSPTGSARRVLGLIAAAAMLAMTAQGGDPEDPLDLGSAGDFVILAKTGVATVPYSDITGDIGLSPAARGYLEGFSEEMDLSGTFSTSVQVEGKLYAADYLDPTPADMTAAISAMETAYTTAADRDDPDTTEFMGGDLSGQTMTPGLHKWGTGVLINDDVTLDALGRPDAIFIFQIAGGLTMASDVNVILSGGAQAKNIFWQVADTPGAVIGTGAHFEGIILAKTAITLNTGASFNGKLLAQTRVDVQKSTIMDADLIPPPQVELEIVSEHGEATPAVGIHSYDAGTSLTNVVTAVDEINGTEYVNVGWTMVGNDPVAGLTNEMSMVITNNAVLTWQWSTNYFLDASADPSAGGSIEGNSNGWYAADSAVTVEAKANDGYEFAGWTGDHGGAANNATQTLTMDQPRTLVAEFAVIELTLEIVSEHGDGTPPVGIYFHDYGTALTNSITDVETIGGTQYVNTGWAMIGNDPVWGNTNTMEMVITNNAVLTWQWSTNYFLNASATAGGAISDDSDANGFYAAGSNVTVTAEADPGYYFTFWTGDFTGSSNDVTKVMTMDQARTLVAHFSLPDCGTPVTLREPAPGEGAPGEGAFMELDLSAMFPGTGWTYEAESALPGVMSAAITPEDKLRLEALSLGVTVIIVTAVKPGDTLVLSFPVQVVGHPNVLIEMADHEPWNPRFEQRIVVENDTGIDCPAIGLRLLFSDIKPGIVIENQTGLAPEPDGRPMIEFSVDFPDGAIQELSVIYVSTGEFRPDQYEPTVEVQYILPNVPPAPDPEGAFNIERIEMLADGRVVLEFTSIPGRYYEIEHAPALAGPWQTVALRLQAGANRTQWIDYGPPATPPFTTERFYRVRGVSP